VAGDCNSLEATHAWFDSKVAHHFFIKQTWFFVRNGGALPPWPKGQFPQSIYGKMKRAL
jgi:hypothetical protein